MEKIFSVGKTAKIVGMTAETLRHYDREGLVRPCKTDRFTGYRYYSEKEIVALTAVKALKQMDLSLAEIKQILSLGDIGIHYEGWNVEELGDFLKKYLSIPEESIAAL